jgi:ABC-type polysaccharide/polyol phosphate export permease
MASEPSVSAKQSRASGMGEGFWDITEGLLSWRLWAFLGLQDIRARYRRSMFGPLWMALGLGVTVLGIGLLYSQILKVNPGNFIPYLAIGLLAWNFVTAVISEGTTLFQAGGGLMTSVRFPYTTLSLRSIVRNLIVMAHCVVPVVLALIFYKFRITAVSLFALPGLLLIVANVYWLSICIALICVRYRDMGQIINYGLGLALFVTPIIWQPSQVRPGSAVIEFNPLYHLISLVRDPIFLGRIPTTSWIVCSAMLAIGGSSTLLAFSHYRKRIVHWI